MPYDDPDVSDPLSLQGVVVESDGEETFREMAACFVEEYLRLGLSVAAILELFGDGRFAGPALAARRLGRAAIEALVEREVQRRGPHGQRLRLEQTDGGIVALPVMD